MTKLKRLRIEKGLTQAQVADAARISRPFVHDLEKGARGALMETWERIAEALECEVTDIMEAVDETDA